MKLKSIACLLLLTAVPAFAATSYTLSGDTTHAAWTGLSNANYTPTATTTAPWGSIAADAGSGTSVGFSKTSGPAYFYGNGIYGWHTAGSTYTIAESAPIVNLANIVFQARLNQDVTISLSYNGGSQNLLASFSGTSAAGAGITDYTWQWDLSSVAGTITDYTINIAAPASTVIYSSSPLTLDTSSSFAQVIPEPASGLLGAASLGLMLTRRRRA